MGESTFINQETRRRLSRSFDLSHFGIDYVLLAVMIGLILLGFLMIYSATPLIADMGNKASDYYVGRQILWAFLGMLAILGMVLIDYHWLRKLSLILMISTLFFLFLVKLVPTNTLGADRSVIGASGRPSELAKLVVIIYVAVWLEAKRDVLNQVSFGLFPLGGILGFTSFMIAIQPDVSAVLTIIALGGLLFFLAGGEWRQILWILLITLGVSWALVSVYPNGMQRVVDFISGLQDITKTSDQIRHAVQGIIAGGVFGTGIAQGSAQYTGLPVAHTDSIFAILAEQTGLVGIVLLLLAYVTILWRGLDIARRAPDNFGRLLAAGISIWIILEAFLNIGVMINLLPNAGNALPFISYGGSNLIISMIGIGILLSISRQADRTQREGENLFGTVVDMRWRDRRRRVPRPVRPTDSLE